MSRNKLFTSYSEAVQYLGNKESRPYPTGSPRSTRVIKAGQGVGIQYHDTIVVEYLPEGIRLSTGGWKTATTKSRLNDAIYAVAGYGKTVYSKRGVWYVGAVVFFDGLMIGYDGKIKNAPSKRKTEATLKRKAKIDKQIDRYCDKLRKLLGTESLPAPTGGDCWYCYFKNNSGQSLGEKTNNSDHLLSHLKEQYIVPSLVWNIVRTQGSQAMRGFFSFMWGGTDDTFYRDFGKDQAVRETPRMVKRYLKEHIVY